MTRATAVQHTRTTGKKLTYDIKADYHGDFQISLAGKVLLTSAPASGGYFGQKRFGTRRQLDQGVTTARTAIEELRGMQEE